MRVTKRQLAHLKHAHKKKPKSSWILNFDLWMKGLITAGLGGAVSSISSIAYVWYTTPHFSFAHYDWQRFFHAASTGAIIAIFFYFKHSPIPFVAPRQEK